MKSTLISLIALGAFTAPAAANSTDRAATGEPMVLSAEQLDGVTAGIALLLPAVQAAHEARRQNATRAPYLSNWDSGLILLEVSDAAGNPTPPGLPQLSSPQ